MEKSVKNLNKEVEEESKSIIKKEPQSKSTKSEPKTKSPKDKPESELIWFKYKIKMHLNFL